MNHALVESVLTLLACAADVAADTQKVQRGPDERPNDGRTEVKFLNGRTSDPAGSTAPQASHD